MTKRVACLLVYLSIGMGGKKDEDLNLLSNGYRQVAERAFAADGLWRRPVPDRVQNAS
jgi:hypothetical protein